MTRRLYYDDSYLTEFRARVLDCAGEPARVYLDQTAFYPGSGGQLFDTGVIGGARVVNVIEEGHRIVHILDGPAPSDDVDCRLDWERRFDHMQQHTGQHALSAVLERRYGIPTLSFHLGSDSSTIDVGTDALDTARLRELELLVNQIVWEDRPVTISYEQAGEAADLRKPSEREGVLRIIVIEDLDRSACGGTHVRRTGEVGAVLLRRLDKIRGNVRIEFLCGGRALRRARTDYDALSQVARVFSAALDETPALVAAQAERIHDVEKQRRRLAIELAQARGRELYRNTPPEPSGLRSHVRRIGAAVLDDDLRAEAQAFTAEPNALFLAVVENPATVLLASSKSGPLHAGDTLKALLPGLGGRGGGNAQLAQGSLPGVEALDALVVRILERLPTLRTTAPPKSSPAR